MRSMLARLPAPDRPVPGAAVGDRGAGSLAGPGNPARDPPDQVVGVKTAPLKCGVRPRRGHKAAATSGSMNTMPQAFDDLPLPRVPTSASSARGPRGRTDAHLKLVVGTAETPEPPRPPSYGLNGRRHLANVPRNGPQPRGRAMDAGNALGGAPRNPQRLEPFAFALVLLVSVAALAVALRAF